MKLLIQNCVSLSRALEVFVHGRNRQVEEEIKREDGAAQQHEERGEGRVLEIGQLVLHRAELDAPARVAAARRGLPAHAIPVRALQRVKVLGALVVIDLGHRSLEHDQRIAIEQRRHVHRQRLIDATVLQRLDVVLRNGNVQVVQRLRELAAALASVAGHLFLRVVAGPLVGRRFQASLRRRPVVHRHRDDVPARVRVDQLSPECRRRCRQRQHDRSEDQQLVVQEARLLQIGALERDLQARAAHPERHRIHVHLGAGGVGLAGGAAIEAGAVKGALRRLLVDEEGQADVHVLSSPGADVLRQRRETRVRVDDVVRDVSTVGDGPAVALHRHCAHGWQVRHGGRDLSSGQGRQQPASPPPHVALHLEEIRGVAGVRSPGRAFDHPSAVLVVPRAAIRPAHHLLLSLVESILHFLAAQTDVHALVVVVQLENGVLDLISPAEIIAALLVHSAPSAQELQDPMLSHVAEMWHALRPRHGRSDLRRHAQTPKVTFGGVSTFGMRRTRTFRRPGVTAPMLRLNTRRRMSAPMAD
eukprot:scaffold517_cov255-Pinguiococcus_pyrenoidosus.AAC.32